MATRAGTGITIVKPWFMSDNEFHYFKLEYKTCRWSERSQLNNANVFHEGWEACVHDETRRSIGEELPEA